MAVLCQLAHPDQYCASEWDLTIDPAGRQYWLNHFARHGETVVALIRNRRCGEPARVEAFQAELLAGLERLRGDPSAFGRLTIPTFDLYREQLLRKHGLGDPYAQVKQRENAAAIELFPTVVGELDKLSGERLVHELARGIFAGNIFDLGSLATVRDYNASGLDFFTTRARLKPRPWLIDDLDEVTRIFGRERMPYRHVLFFVDNAGADVVLGCLPLARHLASRGARVVLAANSTPSLNDITADELNVVLDQLAARDRLINDQLDVGQISVVASGCGTPLVDLSDVTDQCDQAARDSDLLILEGMGRSVESNFSARFKCDCLKIALLKDEWVAGKLGGTLYDIVCRFERER